MLHTLTARRERTCGRRPPIECLRREQGGFTSFASKPLAGEMNLCLEGFMALGTMTRALLCVTGHWPWQGILDGTAASCRAGTCRNLAGLRPPVCPWRTRSSTGSTPCAGSTRSYRSARIMSSIPPATPSRLSSATLGSIGVHHPALPATDRCRVRTSVSGHHSPTEFSQSILSRWRAGLNQSVRLPSCSSLTRSFGNMLRSLVRAEAADMMLTRCSSSVSIS